MLRRRASASPAVAPKRDAGSPPSRGRKRRTSKSPDGNKEGFPSVHPALLLGFLAALLLVSRWSVKFNLPAALPADAPMEFFSEDRALAHARALADDIGVRVVGTAGVEAAERYVVAAARELVSQAQKTRPDLDVEVSVHRPTGSFRLNFLNHDIANAYTNLTNVAVRVRARAAAGRRPETRNSAVLLNAHFDTTLGSPGGADCASCVGILLEQLRVLLHAKSAPPRSPIIFLLNGGEETFMQAAHGFVAHHPWAEEAGAVINVEATGTSGPDVLFRETGGWPAELFMKHAPRPVATATVRDLVRFANLPVDTDFSVFRDPTLEHGNLPGIDLASMLDGYSYHTDRDVVSRIRKGSIQAYGENVMRATEAFAAKLAAENEYKDEGRGGVRVPTAPGQGGAFFDVFGVKGVVVGNRAVALAFHFVPLCLCLCDAAAGGASRARAYLTGSKTAAKSIFFAATVPAALSAARAVVSGRPLAWFGNPTLASILTVPSAVLASFAPYVAAARRHHSNARAENALGAALVSATLAALCGVARAALGYLWVFWSLGLSSVVRFHSARDDRRVSWLVHRETPTSSWVSLSFLFPAAALASPAAYVTFSLINEKVGISGSEPWPLGLVVGDLTMGVAAGACVALAGFGAFPLARCDKKTVRLGVLAVLVTWALFAAAATLRPTYAAATPKRLGVLHQHFERDANVASRFGTGARALDAELLVGAFDAVPAANALAPPTRAAIVRPTAREDFASMHPVTQLLGEGVVLPARAAAAPPWGNQTPALEVVLMRDVVAELGRGTRDRSSASASAASADGDAGAVGDAADAPEGLAAAADAAFASAASKERTNSSATRVSVIFRTRAPAWSCVRVIGDVTAWSLSQTLPGGALRGQTNPAPLWARHAGNGAASQTWRFWVDVPDERAAAALEVQAWSLYPGGDSAQIRDVIDGLGPEISAIAGMTFRSAPTRLNVEK